MDKVILFGAGQYGKEALQMIGKERVAFFVDNNLIIKKNEVDGIKIIHFEQLKQIHNEYDIVISVSEKNKYAIMQQCMENGIFDFILFDEISAYLRRDMCKDNIEEIRQKHFKQLSDFMQKKYMNSERKRRFLEEHIFLKNIEPARGYKRKKQMELVKFATDFLNIVSCINIKPFLIADSLLGQLLYGGFVPWHEHIDFGLVRTEYETLKQYFMEKNKMFSYDEKNKDHIMLFDWVEKILNYNKNEYVLCVSQGKSQVFYGTSLLDAKNINFYCYDICYNKTTDTEVCCIQEVYRNEMDYDMVFPLISAKYEGYNFLIPNNAEEYIKYKYQNYQKLPDNYGIDIQDNYVGYLKKNKTTVEFYLVDAFEIFHFEPLYRIFRENGIYAIFVAENQEINTTGKWFDYNTAKKILEERELEYSEHCDENANFAFSTQDAYVLLKYKNTIKINMTYGDSCNKNGYWFSENAMKGFDYKFVQGMFQKEKCLEKRCLPENHIMVIGRPKSYFKKEVDIKEKREQIRKKLKINTNKKIIGYFPTWDEDSTIQTFHNAFLTLKKDYYIVTKPHHCTFRFPEKRKDMDVIYDISDIILDGNYDFETAALISDINICDAKSGAAIESVAIATDINTIFVSPQKNVKEYFYEEIFDIADAVTNKPEELKGICDKLVKSKKVGLDDKTNIFFDRNYDENDFWKMFSKLL